MTKYKSATKTMTKKLLQFAMSDYGIVVAVAVVVLYRFS